jgi:hypothetical protein
VNAPRFVVEFIPGPGCIDPIKALRTVLKIAGRSFGLRCVSAREGRIGDESGTNQDGFP